MRLISANSFMKSLERLDTQAQMVIKSAVMDLHFDLSQHGGPRKGSRLHRLPGLSNMHSLSPNMDLRVLLYMDGPDYVLLYTDHHDATYAWARRHVLRKHEVTGAMQIVALEERTEVVYVRDTRTRVFGHYDAPYLLSLGVPDEYLPAVQHATDDNVLAVLEKLPGEAGDRLLDLMSGLPVAVPTPAPSGDPFDHPDARSHFHVFTGEDDLQRALSGRWEEWMVYLHPTQRQLAEKRYAGAARVTGSAGTGKTVVALHRAAALARRDTQSRVLLTSFSRTLAARLAEKLTLLLPEAEVRAQVDVGNLHRMALGLARELGLGQREMVTTQLEALLAGAAARTGSELPLGFLRAEWQGVVEPQGLRRWEDYRRAPRTGRGTPLGARARKAIWTVFEAVQADMQTQRLTTWGLLCHEVADALAVQGPRYDHAIADEAQDLGPAEMRLLRALVAPGPDDLFLCGDAGQRIYRGRASWLAMGVNVRGRSTRLKINYRTSREIRQFADDLIPQQVSDEDGESEGRLTLSRFSGPQPDVRRFGTRAQELEGVTDWIRDRLAQGAAPGEIAVFTRTRPGDRAQALGGACGVGVQTLEGDEPQDLGRLIVTTMHRAKGLEFKAVAVLDCDDEHLPFRPALNDLHDPADREAVTEQERQLLYVAATRAREHLLITYTGQPSPFLPSVLVGA